MEELEQKIRVKDLEEERNVVPLREFAASVEWAEGQIDRWLAGEFDSTTFGTETYLRFQLDEAGGWTITEIDADDPSVRSHALRLYHRCQAVRMNLEFIEHAKNEMDRKCGPDERRDPNTRRRFLRSKIAWINAMNTDGLFRLNYPLDLSPV